MLEVLLIVASGYLLRKIGVFKKEDARVFINYVIYLALPVVSFRSAHSLGISKSVIFVVLLAWIAIIFCLVVSFILGKVLRLKGSDLRTFLLVSSFGNTAFLGYPYALSFFGQEGLRYAVIYDSLGSFLLVSTVGFLISRGSVNLKELFTFPPFIGLVLGFSLRSYNFDTALKGALDTLAFSLSPVILFALGLSVSFVGIKRYLSISLFALFIKMVVSFLITYQVAKALKMEPLAFKISLLESSMPSMMMSGVLALKYGLNHELAFASIGLGLLFSFVIVPLLFHLFLASV
ncbi:Auxin Efflux Carrier [Hydrogenobacter thermophilus TK-6]|uniref:Putative membrane protein n=1 Tax=Hydrogenobacter thermophilus (strain DSM 6534 / IAM 12695 / TK-6) TaxID=608538 RepID=D3DFX5_HYDTT|nr:AEC family transporter [Hydrogenobacter thermophilus]ADO44664.1 Auxin Efflux Carrier [Hydrogenobacter thermophilus TK-6]BAI68727.1 putative membrane protein [Hydrogenobacter thermophilus TK-6]